MTELSKAVERLRNGFLMHGDGLQAMVDDGNALRLVLARLAALEPCLEALKWARKYATGFDHLELCIVHAHPHVRDRRPCDCGYDDFSDSLDAAISRAASDEVGP
jgi:hypothetical protein